MFPLTATDLYEVTMAMSYLREGMTRPATFSLFVRKMPPSRGFLVSAGLEPALDLLARYRLGPSQIEAFAAALHRPPRDLEPLLGLEFAGEVRAVPEGRVVLAGEPLLEVTAELPQAQLVETHLLNQVSHQTSIASKAARCVLAAAGRPVVDFSLRRTHGIEAGCQAARVGALVGFAGTSNVAAAARYGLPAVGTMAHSYIEAFPDDERAFHAFARTHQLLLEEDGDDLTLWHADGPPPSAWAEVLRKFPVRRVHAAKAAELAQRISAAYAQGESSAATVVSEVENDADLSRMMQDLPAVEDLLETSDDAPIASRTGRST